MSAQTEKEVIARKNHGCLWCAEAIGKGEKYTRIQWVNEDTHGVSKFHTECKYAHDTMLIDYKKRQEVDDWYDENCMWKYKRGTEEMI